MSVVSESCLFGLAWQLLTAVYQMKCRHRVFAICIPRKSGATTLAQNLDLSSHKIQMIDLEDQASHILSEAEYAKYQSYRQSNNNNSIRLLLFPKMKEFVDSKYQEFSKQKIVLISSDRNLLKFVGVCRTNIIYVSPTSLAFDGIIQTLRSAESEIDNIQKTYNAIAAYAPSLYDTASELQRIIRARLRVPS
jgi:hypothetical protein